MLHYAMAPGGEGIAARAPQAQRTRGIRAHFILAPNRAAEQACKGGR